jgi:hypothetical protein
MITKVTGKFKSFFFSCLAKMTPFRTSSTTQAVVNKGKNSNAVAKDFNSVSSTTSKQRYTLIENLQRIQDEKGLVLWCQKIHRTFT